MIKGTDLFRPGIFSMGKQNANALIPDVSELQGTQAQYAHVLLTGNLV